ncbi:hypothetical protein [Nonomuraea sp. NPDC049158]|uniref:hypothetical protein n=1 Tax=Nonomuraea sp. NPDC049158 TaxID=3155649 RepID=UPI0033F65C11
MFTHRLGFNCGLVEVDMLFLLHFGTALQAMAGDGQALTRALLGSQETSAEPKDERAPARLGPPDCS